MRIGATRGVDRARFLSSKGRLVLRQPNRTRAGSHLVGEGIRSILRFKVNANGKGVVSHAGVGLLREMTEHTGLTSGVPAGLGQLVQGGPSGRGIRRGVDRFHVAFERVPVPLGRQPERVGSTRSAVPVLPPVRL